MHKVVASAEEAIQDVFDGATIMVGGFGLCGNPENLIRALAQKGVKNLTTISNNAGVDGLGVGLLLANGQIRTHIGTYVGENKLLEQMVLIGTVQLDLVPQGTFSERIRSEDCPCGTRSSCTVPFSTLRSSSLFSPTQGPICVRVWAFASSNPTPRPSTPALLLMVVRFLTPFWARARIRFSGFPHKPNPPTMMVAPSNTSWIASSALATTLCIAGEFYRNFHSGGEKSRLRSTTEAQRHGGIHFLFFPVATRRLGGAFLNSCARSNSAASSRESRFSRLCASRCSSFCSASLRFFRFVMAMSRHIE